MSGIYIHIPFCKQACHYCNFHFSTSLKYKADMVRALLKELDLRKDYLGAEPLETIYFGGGTPSLLDQRELDLFFDKLASNFPVSDFQLLEITLEANPDDLNPKKIMELKNTPVNRLSIGVQSFFEKDLQFMNRAHHAGEAEACIKNAQNAGFENLTIDLIYGSPTTPDQNWEKNIEKAVYLNIPHISCYCLTVEPKTALAHFIKKRKVSPPDEEQAARQFDILINKLNKENYAHYEISNFAKKGFYSKHNTNYWKGKKYLGIGPSAHSFDSRSRQWNVAHNIKYMQALNQNRPDIGIEILTPQQQYNEYVMTSLRTMWGINFFKIKNMGQDIYFLKKIKPCLEEGL
ncbi:MAG TPA: radical SAM family heme chaperone HemW, partial [Bacteroidetes bacterium]|nr:radical SAM family heme chaperone HemW [Bacteroidota bacterium]